MLNEINFGSVSSLLKKIASITMISIGEHRQSSIGWHLLVSLVHHKLGQMSVRVMKFLFINL